MFIYDYPYFWFGENSYLDYAGLIAVVMILLYVFMYMVHEDKVRVEVTEKVKKDLIPKLYSNLEKVRGCLMVFEGGGEVSKSLVELLYEGLSITLLSELNMRIPRFADLFRRCVDDLKSFDLMISSKVFDRDAALNLASKIKVETDVLLSEILKIRGMDKLPHRQGGFSSLRR
ncbi:MAG: hypothetical protein NDF57_04120 [archaeon GBS-70-058]|nr:hypothetical protein [Candidatus Culexarchaeum nevadense]